MPIVVMMKEHISSMMHRPRQSLVYGLLGILSLLILIFIINEKNWKPLKGKPVWTASSNYSKSQAYRAIDRSIGTHWSSHVRVDSGIFFEVNTNSPAIMNGLVLHADKEKWDNLGEWVLKTSLDGKHWQTPSLRKRIIYRSMLVFVFVPVKAQYVQIIQTAISPSGLPWRIYELDILQPVVPWQFRRSTLTHWIVGVLFAIFSVLLFSSGNIAPSQTEVCTPSQTEVCTPYTSGGRNLIIPVIMTAILLLGWFLRAYDVASYELSDRETQYFQLLAFDDYTDGEWVKEYIRYTKTGALWLSLLLIRFMGRWYQEYFVSFRIIPVFLGTCLIVLMVVFWRNISQEKKESKLQIVKDNWESLLIGALVSVAGFHVVLSRRGEFSVSLLFFIVLYFLLAYQFLYKQGTYGWVPVLIVVTCTGFFLDPAMGYVPIGILVFGVLHLLVQWGRFGWTDAKKYVIRHGFFMISVLPLYGLWGFFIKEGIFSNILSGTPFSTSVFQELFRALQFCGFAGRLSWLLWGIVLVGFGQVIVRRNHGEWFWYSQGIFLFLLAPEHGASLLLVCLGVLSLLVRGILVLLSLCSANLSMSSCRIVRRGVFTIIFLYFASFSINSLFWGYPAFPQASALYQEASRAKAMTDFIRQILTDPNECKTVGMFEQDLATVYSMVYPLEVMVIGSSDTARLAKQGIFSTYILVSQNVERWYGKEITNFLEHYYVKGGESSQIVLYRLRDEFYDQPRRYYWQDLFFSTGHHIEDDRSSSGIVRVATKDESPGFLAFGPFCRVCTSGPHVARFALRSEGGADEVVVTLQVVASPHESLARLELTGSDFGDSGTYTTFDLYFDLDITANPAFQMKRLQFFVEFTGKAEVRLDHVELIAERR